MENRVHPDLRGLLAIMPQEDFKRDTLPELRREMGVSSVSALAPNDGVTIRDEFIPGPEGAPDIRVRIYSSDGQMRKRPGVLYIHGGGYILGTPENTDASSRRLTAEIGCTVVSVDYRLAPEHPYPAPLEDCYAALVWFSQHAEQLGVDEARIAVTGASAGGGLTAALTLLARDRGGPSIAFQAPLCPMLDDTNTTPSSHEFTDKRMWNRMKNQFGWQMYLGDMYGKAVPPYAAAARSQDLSGLPPTYTYVGELDLFRDETTEYVSRLLRAGVSTEYHIYPGCFHGFEMFTEVAEISRSAQDDYVKVMKKALA